MENNQEFIDASELEGLSPEVQEKYKEFVKPAETPAGDSGISGTPSTDTNPASNNPVTPADQQGERAVNHNVLPVEDEFDKQYPDKVVPLAVVKDERRKRQELEKQLEALKAQPPVQPAVVTPHAQPAPTKLDVSSKEFNRRITKEAVQMWERDNPDDVFDPTEPAHMAEVLEYKNKIKDGYIQYQQMQEQQVRQAEIDQQVRSQIEQGRLQMAAVHGDQFDAIDRYAAGLLEADPREKYYIQGCLREGNVKPLIDFMNNAAAKYKESIAPKPLVKTDAEKLADIESLPGTSKLSGNTTPGNKFTEADIERMILDGTWRNLPEKQREAIIERYGGAI